MWHTGVTERNRFQLSGPPTLEGRLEVLLGLKSRVVLVTGPPGIGKTTLMEKLYENLTSRALRVGGFLTREVREEGKRAGFRIVDLQTGRDGWLAKAQAGSGPMYGRYCIIVADLEAIGVRALEVAAQGLVDIALVDEIGPMEMSSNRFIKALSNLFDGGKRPIVATFKQGSHYAVVEKILKEPSTVKIEVTRESRDIVPEEIVRLLDLPIEDRGAVVL